MKESALVFCEGQLGRIDGKTANGLVRYSSQFKISGVIDSTRTGQDAGICLDGVPRDIPVFSSLHEATCNLTDLPTHFIYGKAPLEPYLPPDERHVVIQAMELGMHIINGLHDFLSDDPELVASADHHGVNIIDIRKPLPKKDLKIFSGTILEITTPRLAVLGTDCAVGKRTTAICLAEALQSLQLNVCLVTTGQTGLIQGAKYGVVTDAMPCQYVIGEVEQTVCRACTEEQPDLVIVEGQSALSHPAFMSSYGILKGSLPQAVILQHHPTRRNRVDFPNLAMTPLEHEISLVHNISSAKVIGLSLNHEELDDDALRSAIDRYEQQLALPCTDVLRFGSDKLVQAICRFFPDLPKRAMNREEKR